MQLTLEEALRALNIRHEEVFHYVIKSDCVVVIRRDGKKMAWSPLPDGPIPNNVPHAQAEKSEPKPKNPRPRKEKSK